MDSFQKFFEDKLLYRFNLFSSLIGECIYILLMFGIP